jgi:hypothetical protein
MERITKVFATAFILITIICSSSILAEEQFSDAQTQIKAPLQTEFTQCVKTFPVTVEKLYYLTLGACSEYNFEIREIQSRGGYIIFETGYRKFLASIIYVSSNKSMLKITPYSNNYDFSPEIPQKIFKYIELNQNIRY